MQGVINEKELSDISNDSSGIQQETDKTGTDDVKQETDKPQSSDAKQETVTAPPADSQQGNATDSQESQKQADELQNEILSELKKLNEGTEKFKDYIEERNDQQDEKETKAQETAETEKEGASDSYDALMSALTDLSDKFDVYTEQNAEILTHMENIEFNTSYGLAFDAVLTGFLSLAAGFLFGRIAFRKL